MQRTSDNLIYSPQDLIQFVGSEFASWMDRFALEHPEKAPTSNDTDEMLTTLFQLGKTHEQQYLQNLLTNGEDRL